MKWRDSRWLYDNMFRYDSPIFQFLNTLGSMIFLHVLWLIFSIPIVTIGPATTAAHYVTLKLVRDEGPGVFPMFIKSFRKNLKQGMFLGVIFTVIGIFLALDLYLCIYKLKEGNIFNLIMFSALGFLSLAYIIEMIYMWAVLARFENTAKRIVINAFFIAMSDLKATSILLAGDILIVVAAVLSIAFVPQLATLFMIFGIPLIFMVNSLKLRGIMDKYVPEKEKTDWE